MLTRREFLLGAGAGALSMAFPALAQAQALGGGWELPRKLTLTRAETREQSQVCYWQDGAIDKAGYHTACLLLRDVSAGVAVQMDARLLDILYATSLYLGRRGHSDKIVITSGYRSVATNNKLRERGVGAAYRSLHIQGKAVDFWVPGVDVMAVAKVARFYGAGGVGVYRDGHVHIDTGPERFWRA